MGYHSYRPYQSYRRKSPPRRQSQRPSSGRKIAICLILCACALFCKLYYPQGISAVQDLLVGKEGGRLQRSVAAVSSALEEGEPLSEVVEAFWQGMQHEGSG